MIITQLRKFSPINIIFIVIVGSLLCLGFFIHPHKDLQPILIEPELTKILSIGTLQNLEPIPNLLLALIFVLVQALYLNKAINNFNFFSKPNYLTALLFTTLTSVFLPFLTLSPPLICNFITIWMLIKLFNLYKQTDVKVLMLDLGIIVAIGSLIYFPFIIMFFLLWIALIIYRPFNWREWISPVAGVLCVYFLVGTWCFWTDRLDIFLSLFSIYMHHSGSPLALESNDLLALLPIGMSLILFLTILRNQYFRSIVHVRKTFQLLFYMLLLIIVSFYLNKARSINHFILCAPALAIYLAYYFTYAKTKWLYESLYIMILGFILYSQFI